ncbi:probable LRR receptor-like serine/threonine-protein kinase At1g14390 [Rosa rugosa]|uniref:probable LRR receptor-like serine/threonine-protein kinase At1g14390 n=1 Tax=Rosa rugosa TaxID=74645 RepID=UPI002B402D47|nr:probable LRR receptor-like serine/threonine-protein kinase At1g14390 [Rosa rugosa]
MKNFWVCSSLLFVIISLLPPIPTAQLTPSESRILFQVQKLLEYPPALQGWSNWTNFCYLPPTSSLKIVCTSNRITELTVVGNKTSPSHLPQNFAISQPTTLSRSFSIDSFFTTVTKLSNLKVLSLVSLGLWGPLPAKINRFWSLEQLNISSNFISGSVPPSLASMKNLRSINLADNLFSGSVPDLKGLALLEEINLGNNHIGPAFPSLGNSLVSLILRNNSVRSQVPKMLTSFDQLQQLDLSYNKFVGPMPSFLFSLPSLQYLNLAQNQLSGALSLNTTCSAKLQVVDVSQNLLIGKLPSCIGSKSSNRTVLDSWNCLSSGVSKYQHPYRFCQKEALAVKPPAKTPEEKEESKIKIGVVLGIIGGIVGVAGVIGLLIFFIIKKAGDRKTEDTFDSRYQPEKFTFRASQIPNSDARHVPQMMRLPTLGLPPYRVFTLEEIEDATNNFDASNLMGEGSQGQVYRGWVRDGAGVLVKCVKLKQKHMPQNFMQNVEALSKLRHRHLVSVLGHCTVTYQDPPNTAITVFIVFENISNGSLRDHLTDWRKKDWLKWPQRMAVTIGIARGVQFLHTGVAPGVFGNNLKMDNILLDESVSAKISNYNLPFQIGSESPKPSAEAEKEDIYQLGVILLQVLTGKLVKSTSEVNELKLELEKGLTEGQSRLRLAIDPTIQGSFAYQSLKTAVEITINCLCRDPSKRPSIDNVLWNLQYAIQVQEGWTSSGNLSAQM